jgi:hypothetical protein
MYLACSYAVSDWEKRKTKVIFKPWRDLLIAQRSWETEDQYLSY